MVRGSSHKPDVGRVGYTRVYSEYIQCLDVNKMKKSLNQID